MNIVPSSCTERPAERGAVYVEFLIAFLPLFSFFLCLVQLAMLQTANLIVKHAAVVATRAAVVILPDDPQKYGGVSIDRAEGMRRDKIVQAATIPLSTLDDFPFPEVRFPTTEGGSDDRVAFGRDDLVRVQVTSMYRCRVPLARTIVCGAFFGIKRLRGEASLPNQGASYGYE